MIPYRKKWEHRVAERLVKISPLEDHKEGAKYFVRKQLRRAFSLFFLGILFTVFASFLLQEDGLLLETEEGWLFKRNAAGDGSYQASVIAEVDVDGEAAASSGKGKREIPLELTIAEESLDDEELEAVFLQAEEEIEGIVVGENESLSHINHDLILPDSAADGLLEVSWRFSDYEIIDSAGRLTGTVKGEDSCLLEITAILSYGERECEYSFYGMVFAKELSPEETVEEAIREAVEMADQGSAEISDFTLPRRAGDLEIHWSEKADRIWWKIFLLMLLLVVFCIYHKDRELTEECIRREKELRRDYPEMVNKLTLYLGAGMTIPVAWERMVSDYDRKKEKRYVYEEMKVTQLQIAKGMPENTAIEAFGRRCGQQNYIRFVNLLSRNIRKGGRELSALLAEELRRSFEERKAVARELGEEAGTKLLMPMGILLVIVLVIVVVPGFWSFGM